METVNCAECGKSFRRLTGSVARRPLCMACVKNEIQLANVHLNIAGCDNWPMCGIGSVEQH